MGIKKTILSFVLLISCFAKGQNMLMNQTLQTSPQFGVLCSNVTLTPDKARVISDTLHTRYGRFAIDIDGWSGHSSTYDTYASKNITAHVVINCDSNTAQPSPWIKNYNGAKDTLNAILTKYPAIRIVVMDNEEMNPNYHTGTIAQYTRLADSLTKICHAHNVLLANGGFGNTFAVTCYAFRWIKSVYGQDSASAFGHRVFLTTSQYNAANTPNSNPSLEKYFLQVDSVMKCEAFDILNFHNYEPEPPAAVNPNTEANITLNAWRFIVEAFKNGYPAKRRLVMINECGQRYNNEGVLPTNMLANGLRLGLIWMDWWSGNGTALGATPLTQDNGTNKPNGAAFKSWQDTYYGTPQP